MALHILEIFDKTIITSVDRCRLLNCSSVKSVCVCERERASERVCLSPCNSSAIFDRHNFRTWCTKSVFPFRYSSERKEDQLHIIQGILCPDLDMVFGDFKYNTRKELCKYDVNHALTKWLQEGRTNINVITVDFVEFANVVPSIIELNRTKREAHVTFK